MSPTTADSGQAASREVHLRDYWKIAWQGRWTIVAVFLVIVASVLAYSFLATPIYRATAVVEVQPQARRVGPGQDVSGLGVASYGWFAEERYQNTQIEIIKSRGIGERAFKALGLKTDPRFKDLKDPVGAFIGGIKVEPRRETGLIEISFEGPNRDEIARWANTVADAYVARNLEKAQENAKNAVDSIKQLLGPLQSELSKAESERFDVLYKKEIYNPENQQEIVRQRLTELNKELNATEVTLVRLGSTLAKIRDLQESGADPMSLPELADDATLKELNRQKVNLEHDVESAKVQLRPGHPLFQEKQSQLNKLLQQITDQVTLKHKNIQADFDLASQRKRDLKEEIRKAEEQSFRVGRATSDYDIVKTDSQTRKQIYDVITKTMNEVAVGANLLANNVSVLDYAIPALRPVKPQKRVNLAIGSLMGIFLGLAAVFFLDYLDNTLRTPEDVERFLKLQTLAVVPKFSPEEGVTASHAVKEAYQSLRTGMIFLSRNRERRVVLITSSGPQEGKSSTVASLARSLASAGDRVVVVDCDLRRPTQHIHLKLERENGLTNYLAAPRGMDDWRPFVKNAGQPNLHAITCGPIPPNPPELLGSERFAKLLAALRESYDWVLLDSPPAVSLADAVLLSSKADMVLLVVQHNQTDRDLVMRTLGQFRNVGANLAGAILNNVDIARAYKKDYYYAGYYYYGADGKKKRRHRGTSRPAATGKSPGPDVSTGVGA